MHESDDQEVSRNPERLESRAWSLAGRLFAWLLIYLGCWLAAYVMVNDDLNPARIADYFVMAWTFNAGERPAFTHFFSLILFAGAVGAAVFRRRRQARHERLLRQIRESD